MKRKPSFYISLGFSLMTFSVNVVFIAYLKINDYLLSAQSILIHIIFAAFVISMLFTVVTKIPDAVKIIITLLIFCVTAFGSFWFNGVGGNTYFKAYNGIDEIKAYNEAIGKNHVVYYDTKIEADFYGDFEDITCYDYIKTGIFQQLAVTVIAKYDEAEFKKEVKRINKENAFYKSAVLEDEPIPVFSFEDFDFRLVKGEYVTYWYPKDLYFIGINDTTNEIAYVSFQDDELDSVWEFENLIYSYAGWHYVIKYREKTS